LSSAGDSQRRRTEEENGKRDKGMWVAEEGTGRWLAGPRKSPCRSSGAAKIVEKEHRRAGRKKGAWRTEHRRAGRRKMERSETGARRVSWRPKIVQMQKAHQVDWWRKSEQSEGARRVSWRPKIVQMQKAHQVDWRRKLEQSGEAHQGDWRRKMKGVEQEHRRVSWRGKMEEGGKEMEMEAHHTEKLWPAPAQHCCAHPGYRHLRAWSGA
jgi:hypothetical protein